MSDDRGRGRGRADLPIDLNNQFREWFAEQLGALKSSVDRGHDERRELLTKFDTLVGAVHDLGTELKLAAAAAATSSLTLARDLSSLQKKVDDPEHGIGAHLVKLQRVGDIESRTIADLDISVHGTPEHPEDGMVRRIEELERLRDRARTIIGTVAGACGFVGAVGGWAITTFWRK